MKKFIILTALCFLIAPQALAYELFTQNTVELEQNEIQYTYPFAITATEDGEITKANGISLLLDASESSTFALWHLDEQSYPVKLSGSAVEQGKVSTATEFVYSDDYSSVYIPVLGDFVVGDKLELQIALRSYEESHNQGAIAVDIDGDLNPEKSDNDFYEIDDQDESDNIAPYPIYNLEYEKDENGNIILSWEASPDPDYEASRVTRTIVKNGEESTSELVYSAFTTIYTDSDLEGVTSVTYSIIGLDHKENPSEPVSLTINSLGENQEPLIIPIMTKAQKPTFDEGLGYSLFKKSQRLIFKLSYWNVF